MKIQNVCKMSANACHQTNGVATMCRLHNLSGLSFQKSLTKTGLFSERDLIIWGAYKLLPPNGVHILTHKARERERERERGCIYTLSHKISAVAVHCDANAYVCVRVHLFLFLFLFLFVRDTNLQIFFCKMHV